MKIFKKIIATILIVVLFVVIIGGYIYMGLAGLSKLAIVPLIAWFGFSWLVLKILGLEIKEPQQNLKITKPKQTETKVLKKNSHNKSKQLRDLKRES
jgi:hypothetical protein